jgi:trigger factor
MSDTQNAGTAGAAVLDNPPAAETETGAPAAEAAEKTNAVITVEDVGPCRKKVTVEIPKETVEGRLKKTFDDFRKDNVLPGFRRGRAPRQLIEKRVGKELRDQLKGQLVMQALEESEDLKKLRTIGEPELKFDTIQLADDAAMKFTFETEVRPTFDLPEYKGLKLHQHKWEVNDAALNEALKRLAKRYGVLEPVDGGKVEADDQITADIEITAEGTTVLKGSDQTLAVAPTRINDIPLEDLPEKLSGAAAGETRTFEVTIHDAFPDEKLRGKKATVTVAVKGIKRVAPATMDEVVKKVEAKNLDELKAAVLDDLEREVDRAKSTELRNQVYGHLLKNTKLDLPTELVTRYAVQLTQRKAVRLMQEGVPYEEIQSHVGELNQEAAGEAMTDLALSYILEDIAEKEGVEVNQEELNTEIFMLARTYGRRFDRMKEDLAKDGRLGELFVRIRERKTLEKVLESATIEQLDHATGPGHSHEHQHEHSA